jgi:hypothetical protein
MNISFEIPTEIGERERIDQADLSRDAKEAYLVGLYRRERITHDELGEALGLGFHQTEELIKKHGAGDDFTLAEFEAERALLRKVIQE